MSVKFDVEGPQIKGNAEYCKTSLLTCGIKLRSFTSGGCNCFKSV